MLHKIFTLILDALFPIRCLQCNAFDYWLCPACTANTPRITKHVCPVCEKVQSLNGQTCPACRVQCPLDGLLPAVHYADIKLPIHYCKYRFVKGAAHPLGVLCVAAIEASTLPLPHMIIPVPLHNKRLRWRGFNQSTLIAQAIVRGFSKKTPLLIDTKIVARTKNTGAQMNVAHAADRQKNMTDAFVVTDTEAVRGKRMWLVDDVCTTGATLRACAQALKKAGAKEVLGIVVARQTLK